MQPSQRGSADAASGQPAQLAHAHLAARHAEDPWHLALATSGADVGAPHAAPARLLSPAAASPDAMAARLSRARAERDVFARLCEAAGSGEAEMVERMLECGMKPDLPPFIAAAAAAAGGEDAAVAASHHAVNASTPLIAAIRARSLATVSVLLRHGADPRAPAAATDPASDCAWQPLHVAFFTRQEAMVDLLLASGADIAEPAALQSVQTMTGLSGGANHDRDAAGHGGVGARTDSTGGATGSAAASLGGAGGPPTAPLTAKLGSAVGVYSAALPSGSASRRTGTGSSVQALAHNDAHASTSPLAGTTCLHIAAFLGWEAGLQRVLNAIGILPGRIPVGGTGSSVGAAGAMSVRAGADGAQLAAPLVGASAGVSEPHPAAATAATPRSASGQPTQTRMLAATDAAAPAWAAAASAGGGAAARGAGGAACHTPMGSPAAAASPATIINAVNGSGDTPFLLACLGGWERCAAALLRAGAAVDAVNAGGATALHLAAGGARLWAQHPLLAAAATESSAAAAAAAPLQVPTPKRAMIMMHGHGHGHGHGSWMHEFGSGHGGSAISSPLAGGGSRWGASPLARGSVAAAGGAGHGRLGSALGGAGGAGGAPSTPSAAAAAAANAAASAASAAAAATALAAALFSGPAPLRRDYLGVILMLLRPNRSTDAAASAADVAPMQSLRRASERVLARDRLGRQPHALAVLGLHSAATAVLLDALASAAVDADATEAANAPAEAAHTHAYTLGAWALAQARLIAHTVVDLAAAPVEAREPFLVAEAAMQQQAEQASLAAAVEAEAALYSAGAGPVASAPEAAAAAAGVSPIAAGGAGGATPAVLVEPVADGDGASKSTAEPACTQPGARRRASASLSALQVTPLFISTQDTHATTLPHSHLLLVEQALGGGHFAVRAAALQEELQALASIGGSDAWLLQTTRDAAAVGGALLAVAARLAGLHCDLSLSHRVMSAMEAADVDTDADVSTLSAHGETHAAGAAASVASAASSAASSVSTPAEPLAAAHTTTAELEPAVERQPEDPIELLIHRLAATSSAPGHDHSPFAPLHPSVNRAVQVVARTWIRSAAWARRRPVVVAYRGPPKEAHASSAGVGRGAHATKLTSANASGSHKL